MTKYQRKNLEGILSIIISWAFAVIVIVMFIISITAPGDWWLTAGDWIFDKIL